MHAQCIAHQLKGRPEEKNGILWALCPIRGKHFLKISFFGFKERPWWFEIIFFAAHWQVCPQAAVQSLLRLISEQDRMQALLLINCPIRWSLYCHVLIIYIPHPRNIGQQCTKAVLLAFTMGLLSCFIIVIVITINVIKTRNLQVMLASSTKLQNIHQPSTKPNRGDNAGSQADKVQETLTQEGLEEAGLETSSR